jgi:hypothetical protein
MHECNAHLCFLSIASLNSWDVTENYSLLIMGDSNIDGDGGGLDGDCNTPLSVTLFK